MLKIYTDGACQRRGKDIKASWGYVVVRNNRLALKKGGLVEGKQTNNTGELIAIREAVRYFIESGEEKVTIFSDSKYSINSLTVWNIESLVKGRRKKNYELIKEIQFMLLGLDVQFVWVKGHSTHYFNNLADEVATSQLS